MSLLYLTDACRLKSYSSATKGTRSLVRVEIEVNDHDDLGWLLRELERLKNPPKPAPRKDAAVKREPERLALPAPLLQITHEKDV